MKLTREQGQKFLRERGIWITEACDRCGQLLGSVRWTRKGESGEWCSAECRDGITLKPITGRTREAFSSVHHGRIGARPAGRPRKHATNAEKQRSYRNRLKSVLALRNTPSKRIENAQLADAKNGAHVVSLIPEAQTLKAALSAISLSEQETAGDG